MALVPHKLQCYYRPQQSWGKVIFSVPCVKNSIHGGGWDPSMPCSRSQGPHPGGKLRGLVREGSPGPHHGGGSRPTPRGVSRPTPRGVYPRMHWGRHPPDGYCCGWYASYWNAFLFKIAYKSLYWAGQVCFLTVLQVRVNYLKITGIKFTYPNSSKRHWKSTQMTPDLNFTCHSWIQ